MLSLQEVVGSDNAKLQHSKIKRQFALFDQDKSGLIERAELELVLEMLDLEKWTSSNVDAFSKELDANGDGVIKQICFVICLGDVFSLG